MGQDFENGLRLIVGPPNSGRSTEMIRLLAEAAERDPVLVVPGNEEAERFERALCSRGASIGVSIRTFPHLFEEIAGLDPSRQGGPRLSPPQRLALARAAITATPLRTLRRSSAAPGFAVALDILIAELQAALVEPRTLRSHAEAAEDDNDRLAAELELAAIYEAYVELRERSGHSDEGRLALDALQALNADGERWRGRPVYLYGFDDLGEVQLELVQLLAKSAAVTIAVNYSDQRALSARGELFVRLSELGGTVVTELEFDREYTQLASLRQLDRKLFEPSAETVPSDGGVHLLKTAGERGEAEAIGTEIAQLLDEGADPEEIVVALRRPGVDGPLVASVLRTMGIPVALAGLLPLDRTAVGRGLIELCAAAAPQPGADPALALLAHLRADPSVAPGVADRLERSMRRGGKSDLDGLIGEWRSPPRHLALVREAREGPPAIRALARCARDLAQAAHRERAPLAGELSDGVPLDPIELRAARVAAETLNELAAAGDLPGCPPPSLLDAVETLQAATVTAWVGTTEGRVRIAGPGRLRGARARFLFCAGMQEGLFPGRGSIDPLLGEQARAKLGIAALRRRDQGDDERYLFHVCVTRPTERLYLSWRQSDDDGRPLPRSPFVDEVLDLIGDGSQESEEEMTTASGLADVVPEIESASTTRALARALSVRGATGPQPPDGLSPLDIPADVSAELATLLAETPDPRSKPGPLKHPDVLKEMSERELLSANSLEGWIQCSYRWFVQHELSPQRLEPEPDPLWLGSVVHAALQGLYLEAPGEDSIPRPGDVRRWNQRFVELLDEAVEDAESPATNPARRVALARVRIQVEAFLIAESESETEMRPRRDLLEVGFGFGFGEVEDEDGDDDHGHRRGGAQPSDVPAPLDLGQVSLRGRIDRIDVSPDGRSALLRDYKTSSSVAGVTQIHNDGKLQLQLYMLAIRNLLGLDPIGGLYQPLGATEKRQPRGMVRKDYELNGFKLVRNDVLEPDRFEEELEAATARAAENGRAMHAGEIDRDPIGGKCPRYCTFQAICRLERAVGLDDEERASE